MTLGILGSMVWDRIEHPDAPVVERWGGISYSLAAAAAALPADWRIRPIVKLGEDLAAPARAFLEAIPGVEWDAGPATTTEPNNRVHLRYLDRHHRHECLTGGVPPWTADELAPRLEGVDALFVNLISGFELDLPTARGFRARVRGLLYADLHSLLLGMGDGGHRQPRSLPDRQQWLDAFDIVQVNEVELALVAAGDQPLGFASAAVDAGLGAFLITRGPAGATRVARPGGLRARNATEPVEIVDVPVDPSGTGPVPGSDPTGCGDVWGATCFVRLMLGDPLDDAMRAANRAAARNLNHRGADGLYQHLKGEA